MNIDHIARQMVNVEPSISLEARIRARLDEVQPEHRPFWWSWRVAVPAGAVAMAALAIAVGFLGSRSLWDAGPALPHVPASPFSQTFQLSHFPTSPLPNFPTSQLPFFPTSQSPNFPGSRLSPVEVAWMERRIPALDPVDALHLDHLRVEGIQPEPLAITPLTITPVGKEGAGTERNHDR